MTGGPDFSDSAQVNSRSITYNANNMPTVITHSIGGTTNVTYDGGGVRAKKSVQGGGTTYYVGENYEVINGASTKYIFAGNLRIAKKTASSTHYFHKDHLGSSSVMTDAAGLAVETTEYMPYGGTRKHTGTEVSNYKFTDQELDPESGLYNYDARLYDPMIGRFISADTIVPRPFDPQSLNRYSYCRNNPLIYVDPSGHHLGGDNGPSDYHDLDDNPGGGRASMGTSEKEYEREYSLKHTSYDRKNNKFYYNDPNYGQRIVEPFKDDVPGFDWTKDRNIFNITPYEEPKAYGLRYYLDKYSLLWTRKKSIVHRYYERKFHGGTNRTYRGASPSNKGSQVTYSSDGKLVDSGIHRGTFDYGEAPSKKHNELDVNPHERDPEYTDPDLSFRY